MLWNKELFLEFVYLMRNTAISHENDDDHMLNYYYFPLIDRSWVRDGFGCSDQ